METRRELQKILWNDISIQKDVNDNHILILVCADKDSADNLLHHISSNRFNIKVYINNEKIITLGLDFSDTEYELKLNTKRTKEDYIPLQWLLNSLVTKVTTGQWQINSSQPIAMYHTDYVDLDRVLMN